MRPLPSTEARFTRQLSAYLASGDTGRLLSLADVIREYLGHLERTASIDGNVISTNEVTATRLEIRRHLNRLLSAGSKLPPDVVTAMTSLRDEQPEYFPGVGDYRFTSYWMFQNAEQWRRDLDEFQGKPDLAFLELGSFEGASACWLLDNILTDPSSMLTCVDLFHLESRFDDNMSVARAMPRLTKRKGLTQEVLRTLELGHYDFIYLDASSSEHDQLEDAVLSWRLLKNGGLMTFDDYGGPPEWESGVTRGTDAFLAAFKKKYEIIHRGFQLTLRKTAD